MPPYHTPSLHLKLPTSLWGSLGAWTTLKQRGTHRHYLSETILQSLHVLGLACPCGHCWPSPVLFSCHLSISTITAPLLEAPA